VAKAAGEKPDIAEGESTKKSGQPEATRARGKCVAKRNLKPHESGKTTNAPLCRSEQGVRERDQGAECKREGIHA